MQPMYPVSDPSIEEPPPVVEPVLPGAPAQRAGGLRNRFARLPRWLRYPLALLGIFTVLYVLFPPPPLDLLVLGLDARAGEGYTTRTDTIMLLGIRPRTASVSLLSIPRDIFINVPGYGSQRINTINVLGELEREGYGPELLSQSIEQSFGIQPDKYARLNFDAFVQLVDAVGGIRVDVQREIVDYQYPTPDYGTTVVRFSPGVQHMDGETALIYARTRHADDDYGRADRQQQVMNALARKLVNPINWIPAAAVVNRNVDTNLNPLEMIWYAPAIVVNGGRIDRLVVNRDYIRPGAQGAVPDYEKLADWLDHRFN